MQFIVELLYGLLAADRVLDVRYSRLRVLYYLYGPPQQRRSRTCAAAFCAQAKAS